MDAKPLSIGKILSERQRFVVPIYQRTYAWNKRELEPLADQIQAKADELLETGKVSFSHYMGALLLIPDADPVFGKIQAFNVVDGQQRLTTFHLCFTALKSLADDLGLEDLAVQLADLVVHSSQTPMQDPQNERYKLQPTQYDRAMFRQLIDCDWQTIRDKYPDAFYKNGKIKPDAPEPLWAYRYLYDEFEGYVSQRLTSDEGSIGDVDVGPDAMASDELRTRLTAVSTVLFEHFRLIVITLAADDDAQVIFETLNSGGKPLAAMDLVRNDVFHRASRTNEDQNALLDQHWSEFEKPFWKQEQTQGRIKKPRIDFFLAHVLGAEQGAVIALGELFSEYKAFVAKSAFPNIAIELQALIKYARTYQTLVEPTDDSALSRLARRLNVFDVSTAYPLVLTIAISDARQEVKDRLYDLIASYVIRRGLCYMTAKKYNYVFIEIAASLTRNGVSEQSFFDAFDSRSGNETSKFPSDEDVAAAIRARPQYNWMPKNRIKLILEELEFAARDKFNVDGALKSDLSIEHVMPQTWMPEWPLLDGRYAPADLMTGVDEDMRRQIIARGALIHTLPNLTLLTPPGNSSAGNASFATKRARLTDSLLKMNIAIAQEGDWNEDMIANRAEAMTALALKLWPSPQPAAVEPASSG